ncbi:host nuclease inhibitor protein [Pseudomonas sp.]|uniref:host nuclease inhibitor protein n=1 Tax=Pseudomonas sp. TaxID=306 RepID=UPI003CC5D118
MSEATEVKTPADQLMEQVQVYASAWALVGGPFDQGNALELAEEEKEATRDMIEDLIEQKDDQLNGIAECVQQLIDWHGGRVEQVDKLLEHAKDGNTIALGDDKNITLDAASAYGMRIGLSLAKHFLGKLPITLTRN